MDLVTHLMQVTPDKPFVATPMRPRDLDTAAYRWIDSGITTRFVRGHKCATVDDLFDEFAAALQFPYYFGHNWGAFDECMADPDWLPLIGGLVVIVRDAPELLSAEQPRELGVFVKVVHKAAHELGEPIQLGESWDRSQVPYHMVLQFPEDLDGQDRWIQARANFLNICHAPTTSR